MDTVVMGTFIGVPVLLVAALYGFSRLRKRAKKRAGPVALIAGNLLVLLTLLSLILLVGEVWFRYFRDTTDSFGNTRASMRWYERNFHLNRRNFRDDIDYRNRIVPGRRRLTILGDSFAAGHGVDDVGDRFANIIRRARPELEVHTMAVPGSGTGAHIQFLYSELRSGYQLDSVVLAYCLNDISGILAEEGEEYMAAVRGMADKSEFVRHSYFLDFLDARLRIRRFPIMQDYFGYVRDSYQGPRWAEQSRRLRELKRLVEVAGGRFHLVVFPFFDRLDEYGFEAAHEVLAAFAREEGIPFLDLLPTYRKHRDEDLVVNAYDAHPNERAHAIAADEILAFLKASGVVR